ncbi:MAG: hypothetical protein SFW66_07565 [Gammaproteobacteria bacterium]|nr:hypothetical protein [Gammaproteobacteria bacterium]
MTQQSQPKVLPKKNSEYSEHYFFKPCDIKEHDHYSLPGRDIRYIQTRDKMNKKTCTIL